MGGIKEKFEKAKESLKKLKKSEGETYAIDYYRSVATSARGNQMVVVVTDVGRNKYVSRGSVDDVYDLVASMVSGMTGENIKNDATIEDLAAEYGFVIIAANPSINKEPTMIYTPENVSENQQNELDNFENQVKKYNSEFGSFEVEIQKIVAKKKVVAPGQMSDSDTPVLK